MHVDDVNGNFKSYSAVWLHANDDMLVALGKQNGKEDWNEDYGNAGKGMRGAGCIHYVSFLTLAVMSMKVHAH